LPVRFGSLNLVERKPDIGLEAKRMANRAGVRGAGGAFSLVLHLILLALVLAWRPVAEWAPPAEAPLDVELETELPPPPPIVEPAKDPGSPQRSTAAQARRAEPAVTVDPSRAYLPPQMPSPPPSGSAVRKPGDGGDGGGAEAGSGTGDSTAGAGASPRIEEMSLGQPDWIVKPTGWEMQEVNPYRAMADHVSGGATIACLVNARKRAHDCVVIRESPGNYGFGAAALKLSVLFRIKPPMYNGAPRYDVRVRIPVFFENLK
jgi:protein TonB